MKQKRRMKTMTSPSVPRVLRHTFSMPFQNSTRYWKYSTACSNAATRIRSPICK